MFDDSLVMFIHEPARLTLLTNLAVVKSADFVFLLNSSKLSRGNLSVQMSRLNEKGLVSIEKMIRDNRPCTIYQITSLGKRVLKKYRKLMFELLDELPI